MTIDCLPCPKGESYSFHKAEGWLAGLDAKEGLKEMQGGLQETGKVIMGLCFKIILSTISCWKQLLLFL